MSDIFRHMIVAVKVLLGLAIAVMGLVHGDLVMAASGLGHATIGAFLFNLALK